MRLIKLVMTSKEENELKFHKQTQNPKDMKRAFIFQLDLVKHIQITKLTH